VRDAPPRIRVLVVDDHEAVRSSIVEFLSELDGLTVVGEGANGLDAVELVRAEGPDVVVMDVRMPMVDGIEATRLIKSARPDTFVMLVTAYEEDELAEAALRAGADRFAVKGIAGAELAALVRSAVA
jgi:DNA-binding NarL/FixJ family response regulator